MKGQMSWKGFMNCLAETGQVTGMIFLLIIGSTIFGSFIAVSELPFWLSDFVSGLPFPPVLIMVMILMVYVITGFFMDVIAVIVLTVPIIHPVLVAMHIDPIWFGVLVVLTIMIGSVTPPVGVLVFTVAGMVKEATIDEIFRGIWPFMIAMTVALVLLVMFPQISLWLPSKMLGY
jgi:TRAP-type C4-dicarboxylate transport system permease large subunit